MSEEENITSEDSLSEEEAAVSAADQSDGEEAVQTEDKSFVQQANELLGKNFKTDDEAKKAIKDTVSYVGKQKEKIREELEAEIEKQPEVDPNKYVTREEFDESTFFSKNPDYEPYKDLLKDLRKPGETLSDVVQKDSVKSIFDKAKTYDEQVNSKSVIHSKSRLGKATTKMQDAAKAMKEGNDDLAKSKAVESVVEAFEL